MIFPIPIYVEEIPGAANQPGRFTVRPLFAKEPAQSGEKLTRALTRLANDLQLQLKALGEDGRHDHLAEWAYSPLLEERTLDLRIELGSNTQRRAFFFAGYTALGRGMWFSPRVPDLSFEVFPGQTLAERAEAALTRHFRELEKDGAVDLDDYALPGKARLTVLELELHPAALAKKKKKPTRAAIFGGFEAMDGESELRRTGRPLHSMYPDDLERAVGRDREIEELARLLAATDRRPVLLVGPRRVGKTSVIHEMVWRMRARKKERWGGNREVWLISPMRLISGMSYLGEWENRVLAILAYAGGMDRVLYFDDLPGLFTAGVSCASDLNVAQVLKPALERRKVRVLAEITPESWRVLRERDRSLADLFHVIPIEEPPESETLRILIGVTRQLEDAHGCTFDLEVVPAVFELHRRHASDAAFPGKAAGFLRRLALRLSGKAIGRDQALGEFKEQSGLQTALLDDRMRVSREELVARLRQQVKGQDHVLAAFADLLVALKARLNDPRRPLGTLLLLGPTGVGKTQSAKALAELLFGGPERLLRLDMNEYVDAASASRLTGTASEPDGLLTGAIRRQPFSVVLFDEIEKAAPEVYDLLLAVLDEGRLTDAIGRVADFTQSVILLTSNLGVQEARSRLGFGEGGRESEDQVFISAAEKFFRPEFVNRLDRIVPFRSLTPAHLEEIARQLLAGVFAREGLQRRNAWLNVTPAAMNQLVVLGHHPQLGARALKRVVEREVAQPVAERLAALSPGGCIIADLDAVDGNFQLRLQELVLAPRTVFWPEALAQERAAAAPAAWVGRILDAADAVLDRVEADLKSSAPSGRIDVTQLSDAQERYFLCQEQVKRVERLMQAAEGERKAPKRTPDVARISKARPVKGAVRQDYTGNPQIGRQRDAIAIRDVAAELEPDPVDSVEVPDSPLLALLRELVLLEAIASGSGEEGEELLVFRAPAPDDGVAMARLAGLYAGCLRSAWGVTVTTLFPESPKAARTSRRRGAACLRLQACFVQGRNLDRLLPPARCSVLAQRPNGSTGLIAINRRPVQSEAEARALAAAMAGTIETIEADSFGPIIHRFAADQTLEDFRTGLSIPDSALDTDFRALWLSSLALPPEMEPAIN